MAERMRHRIEHALEQQQARGVLDEAFATYLQCYARYLPHLEWHDGTRAVFGFRFRGLAVTGTLTLVAGALEVEVQVPWMLRPLQALARRTIEAEAERLLTGPDNRTLHPHASGSMGAEAKPSKNATGGNSVTPAASPSVSFSAPATPFR